MKTVDKVNVAFRIIGVDPECNRVNVLIHNFGSKQFYLHFENGDPVTEDVFKSFGEALNWAVEFFEIHAEDL